jgi:hypothetical protein
MIIEVHFDLIVLFAIWDRSRIGRYISVLSLLNLVGLFPHCHTRVQRKCFLWYQWLAYLPILDMRYWFEFKKFFGVKHNQRFPIISNQLSSHCMKIIRCRRTTNNLYITIFHLIIILNILYNITIIIRHL